MRPSNLRVFTFPELKLATNGFSRSASNLRVFTFPELKSATNGFSRSTKIGEGGCECVYIGAIKSD
ncbi:hypothetical protein Lser_V15G31935 [Lactuca serriola]